MASLAIQTPKNKLNVRKCIQKLKQKVYYPLKPLVDLIPK